MLARNINPDKLTQYLLTLEPRAINYVNKIVDNTIYITTDKMIEMVNNSLNKFKELHQHYNLYIPNGKIGSEHYILLKLKQELHPVKIIYGNDKSQSKLDNDYPIIILDDAIYTSCNACYHVDCIEYDLQLKNKIFLIVAVLSSRQVQVITEFNTEIICDMMLEHLLPQTLFDDYDETYFYDQFGCETTRVLPLFFEHKIANAFGSYQFYHTLCDQPVSRAVIDKITKDDIINSF